MEIVEQYLLPFVLAIVAVVMHVVVWRRHDRNANFCLGVYSGSYVLTTVVGATILSFVEGAFLPLGWGLDTSFLWTWSSATYWTLLYLPLIIVPLCLLVAAQLPSAVHHEAPASAQPQLSFVAMVLWVAFLSAYCFYELHINGYLGNANWADFGGNYYVMIAMRTEMFGSLSSRFFGILYTALPCLSFSILYMAIMTRGTHWWALFAGTVGVFVLLSLSVLLKGYIILYGIILFIALADLKGWRLWTVGQVVLPVVILLTFLQTFFAESWTIMDSISLLLYRMASSHVFYVNIFPEMHPHYGPDLALNLIGMAQPPSDCVDVFRYMYPTITRLQGHAAAPAHTRAYAQAGMLFAIATMFVIGAAVVAVSRLRRVVVGPLTFGLYMQALGLLYLLTQTSVIDCIFSPNGLIWAGIGLFPFAVWELIKPRLGDSDLPAMSLDAPALRNGEAPRLRGESQAAAPLRPHPFERS